jgi:hypothetical protein
VVAMIASFLVSTVIFVMKKYGHVFSFSETILYGAVLTTASWLPMVWLSAPTTRERLIAFYKKVHPAGPGWTKIRKEARVTKAEAALHGDHMGLATTGWISGCIVIWSSLFAIGNFLYGRLQLAMMLSGAFIVSGAVLIYVINHLWTGKTDESPQGPKRMNRKETEAAK